MLNSKALKPGNRFEKPDKPIGRVRLMFRRIRDWWWETPVFEAYKKVKRFYYRLKKWIEWRPILWENYDFDAHTIYQLLRYKLERIYRCLENGHAIQEERDMKALRLAIKLAKRLEAGNYEDSFYDRHDKKWGELKTWFEPIPGSTNSYWRSSRPNAVTEQEKEQERKETRELYEAAQSKEAREKRWLFAIISKYDKVWWD
jgi:hypothetical protein